MRRVIKLNQLPLLTALFLLSVVGAGADDLSALTPYVVKIQATGDADDLRERVAAWYLLNSDIYAIEDIGNGIRFREMFPSGGAYFDVEAQVSVVVSRNLVVVTFSDFYKIDGNRRMKIAKTPFFEGRFKTESLATVANEIRDFVTKG
jgi:hypothetical protein